MAKKTAPVKLIRDAWNDEGERCSAGSIVDVEVSTAKRLIENGAAERADPMPGD